MAFRRWCEISPWDKEDECLDMSSFEKESLNLIKKHSSVIVQARIESRIFSNQEKPRSKTIPKSIESYKDMKMINFMKTRNKSLIKELGGECIKMKTKEIEPLNYGKCLSVEWRDEIVELSSCFAIKKHSRVKNFERSIFKQQKMQEIFRRMYDIENPVQRRNLNLPKIEVKL